mgnify:CR=1 FL=1
MNEKKSLRCLNSLSLKLLAMALMLCDHMWATVIPGNNWLTAVGRLAFPIFAYQVAEGFFLTHDRKKYLGRMFIFALISEIPFDLLYYSSVVFPFHQNVMFTFCLAILLMMALERAKSKGPIVFSLAAVACVALGMLLGQLAMVDYYGSGVVTVLLFYFCRGWKWGWLPELAGLLYLNGVLLAGEELTAFGVTFPEQGLAVLALVPILCYRGRQGPHSRAIQYACYAFYPVHMLILFLAQRALG